MSIKNKFKVGDRVKMTNTDSWNKGKLATIIGYHANDDIVFYKYDDGTYGAIATGRFSYNTDVDGLVHVIEKCSCNCHYCRK